MPAPARSASGRNTRTCRPTPSSSSRPVRAASAPPASGRPPCRVAKTAARARATARQAKANVVPNPTLAQRPKPVAPTVVQASPGATTRFITRPATPPAHQQIGHAQDRGDARVRQRRHPAAAPRARRLPPWRRCRRPSRRSGRSRRRPDRPRRSRLDDGGERQRRGERRCRLADPVAAAADGLLRLRGDAAVRHRPRAGRARHPVLRPDRAAPSAAERDRRCASSRSLVYGIYFVGCWSVRGQTLAMQTWRIRVVTAGGARLGQARAAGALRRLLRRLVRAGDGWSPRSCTCAPGPARRDRRSASSPTRCSALAAPGPPVLARHRLRHAPRRRPRRARAGRNQPVDGR